MQKQQKRQQERKPASKKKSPESRKKPQRKFLHYVFDDQKAKDVIDFMETCCYLHKGKGGGAPIKLRPWQKHFISELFGWIDPATGLRRYRTLFLALGRKNGKALDINTKIPTPTGWTTMGDIQVGDTVLDEHGNVCSVVAATDVMRNRPCYQITFSNGQRVIADAEHQWYVHNGKRHVVLTTKAIADSYLIKESVTAGTQYEYSIDVSHTLLSTLPRSVQITDVQAVDSVPVRCIQVDSPSNLFLFGETMLPTHNSTLVAAIGAAMLYFDDEPGAEVILAANSQKQAGIVFKAVDEMVVQSPILRDGSKRVPSLKIIEVPETSSALKTVSCEAANVVGLDPSCVIFDEIAFAPNRKLHDALVTASGARTQPLTIYITTAGYDFQGIGFQKWQYARLISEKPEEDPTFLPVLYEVPLDADWTAEQNWYKANPALGDFRQLDELRIAYKQAVTPSDQAAFRMFYLNQWVEAPDTWLPRDKWDACIDKTITEEQLRKAPCYLAFDLSATQDLTAVAACWSLGNQRYYIRGFNFLPDYDGNIRDKELKDHAPYMNWVEHDYLTLTPGTAVDQDFIERKILDLAESYNVKCVGYDPFSAHKLVTDLEKKGLTLVKVRPGPLTLSEPMKEFERAVLQRRILHDGNPCVGWQVANLVPRQDAIGNIAPSKDKSVNRIDCVVAAIMALHCALRSDQTTSDKPKPQFRITVLG